AGKSGVSIRILALADCLVSLRTEPFRDLQAGNPFVQAALALPIEGFGLVEGDLLKPNSLAGPQLAEEIEVGPDHLSDLWIAADGLAVHTENDSLAFAGYL